MRGDGGVRRASSAGGAISATRYVLSRVAVVALVATWGCQDGPGLTARCIALCERDAECSTRECTAPCERAIVEYAACTQQLSAFYSCMEAQPPVCERLAGVPVCAWEIEMLHTCAPSAGDAGRD
mgnify:CR=1 FL=1